ncbi:MAG: agmatinase [Aestuariivita sp.]|nr:agmatinase [Aestuariivita sp.]MCY4201132.1 agmatinase [Aestuariivita sp.]MCY4287797.1 agmatinase [Aestuariivita sp.]MCY4345963.1 agmatinase [Aestuariivita sp.]
MALEDAKDQIDLAFTREEMRGPSFELTFGGALSFLRRKYTKDLHGVDIVVTGVPFDQAVTNRPGTRLGPRQIREASSLQAPDPPYGWPYDPLTDLNIIDYGDLAFDYADLLAFPDALTTHIDTILKSDAATLVLGGDHYISYPILRAYHQKFGKMSLLQFDAHTDTWADDAMNRIDHGTMFYKAVKSGFINTATSVQVGIRTVNNDTLGISILDARWVHENGATRTAARIRAILADNPTYLSFDIDALDPAFAPGTGTPVWGGLASWQVAAILREIDGIDLKGGDVVEVSPPYDTTGATAIAAAHIATEIICLIGSPKKSALGAKRSA